MKPIALTLSLAALLLHCSPHQMRTAPHQLCTARALTATEAPGIPAELRRPGAWIARAEGASGDTVLMSPDAISALNTRNQSADRASYQDVLDERVASPQRVAAELLERMEWLDAKLASKAYVEDHPGSYVEAKARIEASSPRDTLHIVAREADIRCVPMNEGLFTQPKDIAFDRNRCSRVHLGEVIRVLRTADEGAWLYVHAGHSVGWLNTPKLSPSVSPEDIGGFRGEGAFVVVTDDSVVEGETLRMGRRFPLLSDGEEGWTVLFPTTTGLIARQLPRSTPLHLGPMPMTREGVLKRVMARLDEPYGWGGYEGGRDCSRLLLDLFSVFGVALGRHSLVQARAGSTVMSLTGMTERQKKTALREANAQGIVFVYMPGHIMLHLGEVDGRPYALSSISEFVQPCKGGDQVVRLDRVAISDYELGRGTERTSFIERITTLSIFGGP